jgi:SpoVK/Ycf46/Vps4 family AAA+-type ATPase
MTRYHRIRALADESFARTDFFTQIQESDVERVFSGDLWQKSKAIGFFCNLLSGFNKNLSRNAACWDFVEQVLTHQEIEDLYESIIPVAKRREINYDERFRRNIPELIEGASIADVLEFLHQALEFRKKMLSSLKEILQLRAEEFMQKFGSVQQSSKKGYSLRDKVNEVQKLFKLSDLESDLMLVVYLQQSGFWDMEDLFTSRRYRRQSDLPDTVAQSLNISATEMLVLLAQQGKLRSFGILDDLDLELTDTFMGFLNGLSDKPLCDRFYAEDDLREALPWEMHGRLAENEGQKLIKLLASKTENKPKHVLLYGLSGTGKTAFAKSLAAKLGKKLYFINQVNKYAESRSTNGTAFRFAGLEAANQRLEPEECIICVDECDKMLNNSGLGHSLFRYFGLTPDRDGESKGRLNAAMDNCRHSIIWIANSDRDSIDLSSRRRFDYNVYFDNLSPSTLQAIWGNCLKRYDVQDKLREASIEMLSRRYPVNAGGIDCAVRNAADILRQNPEEDFQALVLVYLRSYCDIMNIQEDLHDKSSPARDYSLKGLNLKSSLSLERIIQAGRNYLAKKDDPGKQVDSPRLNLLLYGPPGTGKTEFVRYLASSLDRKLTVKMASDLLNPYVGGTEQRIVAAFREAEQENTILFMDEGDAILRTRANATRSWETSQVVTLLHEMEHFNGIFIMASNFAQNLDIAALRRFTYKLQFDYLDAAGKLHFFKLFFKHFKLPALSAAEKKQLEGITDLSPGDFRNVRQQTYYLETAQLDNKALIQALQEEVSSKQKYALASQFNTQNRIGFGG